MALVVHTSKEETRRLCDWLGRATQTAAAFTYNDLDLAEVVHAESDKGFAFDWLRHDGRERGRQVSEWRCSRT